MINTTELLKDLIKRIDEFHIPIKSDQLVEYLNIELLHYSEDSKESLECTGRFLLDTSEYLLGLLFYSEYDTGKEIVQWIRDLEGANMRHGKKGYQK